MPLNPASISQIFWCLIPYSFRLETTDFRRVTDSHPLLSLYLEHSYSWCSSHELHFYSLLEGSQYTTTIRRFNFSLSRFSPSYTETFYSNKWEEPTVSGYISEVTLPGAAINCQKELLGSSWLAEIHCFGPGLLCPWDHWEDEVGFHFNSLINRIN